MCGQLWLKNRLEIKKIVIVIGKMVSLILGYASFIVTILDQYQIMM